MTSTPSRPGFAAALLRRKPVEDIEQDPDRGTGLARTLNLRQLTAIGVGGIIGAGIFSLAGQVAHETAGPAVLISFLVAGVASAAAAFSCAEKLRPGSMSPASVSSHSALTAS